LIHEAFPAAVAEEADEVAAAEWEAEAAEEEKGNPSSMAGWGSWTGLDLKPAAAPAPPKFKTDKVIMGPSNDRKAA
jgi:hypothetical protein